MVDIRQLRDLIEAAALEESEGDDVSGDDDGGGCNNLVLVMNLNVRVVLCDCGQAYKLPQMTIVQQQQQPLDAGMGHRRLLPFHKKTLLAVKRKLKERF